MKIQIEKLVIFFIVMLLQSAPILADTANINGSWFRPSLVTDNEPQVCASLLSTYTDYFVKSDAMNPLEANFYESDEEQKSTGAASNILQEIKWKSPAGYPEARLSIVEFNIDGQYYAFVRQNYDIGWREGYHHEITINKPFEEYKIPEDGVMSYFDDNEFYSFAQLPDGAYDLVNKHHPNHDNYDKNIEASPVNYYRKGKDVYALFAISRPGKNEGRRYALLKVEKNLKLKMACELQALPSTDSIHERRNSIESMSTYSQVLTEMMGQPGNCGTLNSLSGAINAMNESLDTAIYRPWLLTGNIGYHEEHSVELDNGVTDSLSSWGYSGIWNYSKYKKFHEMTGLVEASLAKYYQANFKLDPTAANSLAKTAISTTLIRAFDHGKVTDNYNDLHKKVLTGISADELKLIDLPNDIDTTSGDSLLDYAITQPQLINILLMKGLDPNKTNIFNKTPLMYAAQFNDITSAKILLENNASTEIATTAILDGCDYTYTTSHLTALHYAVKYASKEFIQQLIDNGAATFAKDSNGKTPLNYLLDFGGVTGYERSNPVGYGKTNPNLSASDIVKLTEILQPPDDLTKYAHESNLLGEKLYRENNYAKAYSEFTKSFAADPKNPRILNNLAVTALKIKRYGEAAKYSQMVIDIKPGDPELAAAYFNMGMACSDFMPDGYLDLEFDKIQYCQRSALDYFIKSYKAEPTPSRLSAINTFFTKYSRKSATCTSDTDDDIRAMHVHGSMVYALVPANFDTSQLIIKYISKEEAQLGSITKMQLLPDEVILEDNSKIISFDSRPSTLSNVININGKICSPLFSKIIDENTKIVILKAGSDAPNSINVTFKSKNNIIPIYMGDNDWHLNTPVSSYTYSPIVLNSTFAPVVAKGSNFIPDDQLYRQANDSSRFTDYLFRKTGLLIYAQYNINHSSDALINDELLDKPRYFVAYNCGQNSVKYIFTNQGNNNYLVLDSHTKTDWNIIVPDYANLNAIINTNPDSSVNLTSHSKLEVKNSVYKSQESNVCESVDFYSLFESDKKNFVKSFGIEPYIVNYFKFYSGFIRSSGHLITKDYD